MSDADKEVVWLSGKPESPPFSEEAQDWAGYLIRQLQHGDLLSMPHSRTMSEIGKRCHELRIPDGDKDWRIMYRIDSDAILILEIWLKKTQKTPPAVIRTCQLRMAHYDQTVGG